MVDALEYPLDKKFHRFFPMDKEDFYFASERTESYTIIEISMFEGRTIQAKKQLVKLLFERINNKLNISPQDVEITIFETPKHNWGIRGLPGDELALNYKVNIWYKAANFLELIRLCEMCSILLIIWPLKIGKWRTYKD